MHHEPVMQIVLVLFMFFIDQVSQPGCIYGRRRRLGLFVAGEKRPLAARFHRLTCILTRDERTAKQI